MPEALSADAPLVAAFRGGALESVHRGRYAVVDVGGTVLDAVGDPEGFVWVRSSAKPFQALPILRTGAADAFGLTDEELAVACGSHGGEERHLTAVRSILSKIGLSEADLQNGTHPPMYAPAAAELALAGEEPRAIHGNCSGKHAGMLAVCVHAGWDPRGYRDPQGPSQKLVRRTVAEVCGLRDPEEVRLAGDGCGVPVFGMPLRNLALGFARLAAGGAAGGAGGDLREDLLGALLRVRDVMREHPYMVAGTGRFDTRIMEPTGLVVKGGAEGVFACGNPEERWGLALKVSDGSGRAVAPAAVAALGKNGVRGVEDLGRRPVKDLHGEVVGEVLALL